MNIIRSTRAYETWLKGQLEGAISRKDQQKDLDEKHGEMRKDPFRFLRATYYRWAETILTICPEFAQAPSVVAVGDIHLENFGTWRDDEGRLVWGVNDYDEAAEMPYALDLVRLGVSAVLGCPHIRSTRSICDNILRGYTRGLEDPHPIVLDHQYAWLRKRVVVPNSARAKFWQGMEKIKKKKKKSLKKAPSEYLRVLAQALPEPKRDVAYGPRSAGLGSRGRPRWVGIAEWQGAPVVREAKAALPSAWTCVTGRKAQPLYGGKIATARYRAPDPWYALVGKIVVRRLSPNNRKLDAAEFPLRLTNRRMLRLMGRELAAVHLGLGDHGDAVRDDIKTRERDWLLSAVERMAKFVRSEQKEWRSAKQ